MSSCAPRPRGSPRDLVRSARVARCRPAIWGAACGVRGSPRDSVHGTQAVRSCPRDFIVWSRLCAPCPCVGRPMIWCASGSRGSPRYLVCGAWVVRVAPRFPVWCGLCAPCPCVGRPMIWCASGSRGSPRYLVCGAWVVRVAPRFPVWCGLCAPCPCVGRPMIWCASGPGGSPRYLVRGARVVQSRPTISRVIQAVGTMSVRGSAGDLVRVWRAGVASGFGARHQGFARSPCNLGRGARVVRSRPAISRVIRAVRTMPRAGQPTSSCGTSPAWVASRFGARCEGRAGSPCDVVCGVRVRAGVAPRFAARHAGRARVVGIRQLRESSRKFHGVSATLCGVSGEIHTDNVGAPLRAPAQMYGRTSMTTDVERVQRWPRLRNVLILAGDVVGVVVLIVAVALIGSHGTSLDLLHALGR
ncbi:hypothetical protein DFR70_112160 [Nocardia tenerifensis]|uniref:Uncharacterized protein n=2 Tax=Nocardia tenerifensis TaxID=228006 RepID=A0A318JUW2_9NOCA|nr:hypothetical protein DFR70_112160 [Nocardia tenerifensis]